MQALLALVSPGAPPYPIPEWLSDHPHPVVILPDGPDVTNAEPPAAGGTGAGSAPAATDLAADQALRGGLSAVLALGQDALLRAGSLRERAGSAGAKELALAMVDLPAQRIALTALGLPTPSWRAVRGLLDLELFAGQQGFPCRVRPRRPISSAGLPMADHDALRDYYAAGVVSSPAVVPNLVIENVPMVEHRIWMFRHRGVMHVLPHTDAPDPLVDLAAQASVVGPQTAAMCITVGQGANNSSATVVSVAVLGGYELGLPAEMATALDIVRCRAEAGLPTTLPYFCRFGRSQTDTDE